MFLGGLPVAVVEQMQGLLDDIAPAELYVCCSGTFRSERGAQLWARSKQRSLGIHSNDVSLLSGAIGHWLAGGEMEFAWTGELAWLEELTERDPLGRAASACFALDYAEYGARKPNAYRLAHIRELREHAPARLEKMRAKLAAAFAAFATHPLQSYQAHDWIKHAREGSARGACVVAFPPTYKGGYERMFGWLHKQAQWSEPSYDLFDPASLKGVVDELAAGGSPYIIFADQKLPGHEPRALLEQTAKHPCWLYASEGHASLRRKSAGGRAALYRPLDLRKLTATSELSARPLAGPEALWLRQRFIKTTIEPVAGLANYGLFLDGMLLGILTYSMHQFRSDAVYLLSDICVSREARLSKLVSRCALNGAILDHYCGRALMRLDQVETTAFADHPVSMKYRGLYELLARNEQPAQGAGPGGWRLQYGASRINETLSDAYAWWWRQQGGARAIKQLAAPRGGERIATA